MTRPGAIGASPYGCARTRARSEPLNPSYQCACAHAYVLAPMAPERPEGHPVTYLRVYWTYLLSPDWEARRQVVLERARPGDLDWAVELDAMAPADLRAALTAAVDVWWPGPARAVAEAVEGADRERLARLAERVGP